MATKYDIVMIVILGDLDYRYDRRVDPDFLDLFDARGTARFISPAGAKIRLHQLPNLSQSVLTGTIGSVVR